MSLLIRCVLRPRAIIAALIIVLALTGCGHSTQPSSAFVVSGTVTDGQTGAPLANVNVQVMDAKGVTNQGQTNSSGAFSIVGVASGTAVVTASAPGYQSSSKSVTVSGNTTVSVSLVRSVQAPTVTLQVQCHGSPGPCVANIETDLYYSYTSIANSISMDFGDGQTCGPSEASCNSQAQGFPNTRTWFPHIYPEGTFMARLSVANSDGTGSATATVVVKSLAGLWVSGTGSDGCIGRRALQMTQSGASLSGTYTNPAGSVDSFNGTINSSYDVTINVPGPGLVFSGLGIDGNGIDSTVNLLKLRITSGDASCGQPLLTFERQ